MKLQAGARVRVIKLDSNNGRKGTVAYVRYAGGVEVAAASVVLDGEREKRPTYEGSIYAADALEVIVSYAETNRPLRLEVNRLTSIDVPEGTLLTEVVTDRPQGFAIDPEVMWNFIDPQDSLARHDVQHRWLWVPSDAVRKVEAE